MQKVLMRGSELDCEQAELTELRPRLPTTHPAAGRRLPYRKLPTYHKLRFQKTTLPSSMFAVPLILVVKRRPLNCPEEIVMQTTNLKFKNCPLNETRFNLKAANLHERATTP